jgi:calcineurin-like phosphoesterase
MTGPRESVLGREIEACLGRFIDGMPRKCPVAENDVGMQGCLVKVDRLNGITEVFERVEYRI